jgi:hypothetical protein
VPELAEMLDRMCDNGMIERRSDPDDRRVKRLYLTPAARPVLDRFAAVGQEMMQTAGRPAAMTTRAARSRNQLALPLRAEPKLNASPDRLYAMPHGPGARRHKVMARLWRWHGHLVGFARVRRSTPPE